jgi:hypothetical protein
MAIASASYLFTVMLAVDFFAWSSLFLLVASQVAGKVWPQALAVALGLGFAVAILVYERSFFTAETGARRGEGWKLALAATGRLAVIVGSTFVAALALELIVFGAELRQRQIDEFLNSVRYEALLVHDAIERKLGGEKNAKADADRQQTSLEQERADQQAKLAAEEAEQARAHDDRATAEHDEAVATGQAGYWRHQASDASSPEEAAAALRRAYNKDAEAKRAAKRATEHQELENAAVTRAQALRRHIALLDERVTKAIDDVRTKGQGVVATTEQLQTEWRRVHDEIARIEAGASTNSIEVNGKTLSLHPLSPLDRVEMLEDLGAGRPPRWPATVPEDGRRRALELFGRDTDEAAVASRLRHRAAGLNALIWMLRGITLALPILALLLKFVGGAQSYYSLPYQCALGHPGAIEHREALRGASQIAGGGTAPTYDEAKPVHLDVTPEDIDENVTLDPAEATRTDASPEREPVSGPVPIASAGSTTKGADGTSGAATSAAEGVTL